MNERTTKCIINAVGQKRTRIKDIMTHKFNPLISMTTKNLLGIFILILSSACAQSQHDYQARIAGFEYIEVVKGKNNGKLPLLIAFHYSSGTPAETVADYDRVKNPIRIIIP